jgi:hypothetical protein
MRQTSLVVFVLALAISAVTLAGMPRPIVLHVSEVPLAWGDGGLTEKLIVSFSRDPELRVIVPQNQAGMVRAFPTDRTNLDSLLAWGVESGGKYLLTIAVSREDLECRKTFSVPLLFHRYETLAVIAGEIRLVDLQKRRVLLAEPFEEKVSAARQFQSSSEDDSHDPTLHLTASEKQEVFELLETQLVERLTKRISRFTRGY